MNTNNLLQAVKDHALANYERDGWDFLVECHGDADIIAAIGTAITVKGAIRNVARNLGLRLHDEQRASVRSMGGEY